MFLEILTVCFMIVLGIFILDFNDYWKIEIQDALLWYWKLRFPCPMPKQKYLLPGGVVFTIISFSEDSERLTVQDPFGKSHSMDFNTFIRSNPKLHTPVPSPGQVYQMPGGVECQVTAILSDKTVFFREVGRSKGCDSSLDMEDFYVSGATLKSDPSPLQ